MTLSSTGHLVDLNPGGLNARGASLKTLIDELQALFHGATGHTHAGNTASATGPTLSAVGITNGAVMAALLEADLLRYVDVQLTNVQVKALRATPITLVAAPGVNRAIIVREVYAVCDSAAGAYTETVNNFAIEYSNGNDILVVEATGWIDQTSVNLRLKRPDYTTAEFIPTVNQAVQVKNNGAGEIDGGHSNNSLSWRVWYSVVDTAAFT